MRTALPEIKPNGHVPQPTQVFVISGLCQKPTFRLRRQAADEFCLIYLGAPEFSAPAALEEAEEAPEDEPFFLLRRWFENREAVVALRVDWEGIFTLLANDDGCAEAVYAELIEPGEPEEVQRHWSQDASTLAAFREWLLQE